MFKNHSALAVPYRTAFVPLLCSVSCCLAVGMSVRRRTCLHPVLIMPPMVAPNRTQNLANSRQEDNRTHPVPDQAEGRAQCRVIRALR